MTEKKICREIKTTAGLAQDALKNLAISLGRAESNVRTMLSNNFYNENIGNIYLESLQQIYLSTQTLLIENRKTIVQMNKEKLEFKKLKKEKKENERVKIIN